MGRIRLLEPELIDQIAAGEVVERPASALKELVENSIDAEAENIRVSLTGAGLENLTVIDDGFGMSAEDARLCLSRHATSKLPTAEALQEILTMGFRGEALPSIASVSRLTLTTSERSTDMGVTFRCIGGALEGPAPAAPIGGTRIAIDDLFFNVPARKKFLKRAATELHHCREAIVRLALAHPELSFTVEHEGRRILATNPSDSPKERVIELLGEELRPHLLTATAARLGVSVEGVIAAPELSRPTASGIYMFINRRYIRDRALNAALARAYRGAIPQGKYPVAVLFLTIDPHTVDVNVHPQKLEVRLRDPRLVTETLAEVVREALHAAPWNAPTAATASAANYALAVERFLAKAAPVPVPMVEERPPAYGTRRPDLNAAAPKGYWASLIYRGELGGRFWLCEAPGKTLVVVDPRGVRARQALRALRQPTQSPTFPLGIVLRAGEKVLAAQEALGELGVEFEAFGPEEAILRALPIQRQATPAELSELLEALAQSFADGGRARALLRLARFAGEAPWRSVTASEAHTALALCEDELPESAELLPKILVRTIPFLELEGL